MSKPTSEVVEKHLNISNASKTSFMKNNRQELVKRR